MLQTIVAIVLMYIMCTVTNNTIKMLPFVSLIVFVAFGLPGPHEHKIILSNSFQEFNSQ